MNLPTRSRSATETRNVDVENDEVVDVEEGGMELEELLNELCDASYEEDARRRRRRQRHGTTNSEISEFETAVFEQQKLPSQQRSEDGRDEEIGSQQSAGDEKIGDPEEQMFAMLNDQIEYKVRERFGLESELSKKRVCADDEKHVGENVSYDEEVLEPNGDVENSTGGMRQKLLVFKEWTLKKNEQAKAFIKKNAKLLVEKLRIKKGKCEDENVDEEKKPTIICEDEVVLSILESLGFGGKLSMGAKSKLSIGKSEEGKCPFLELEMKGGERMSYRSTAKFLDAIAFDGDVDVKNVDMTFDGNAAINNGVTFNAHNVLMLINKDFKISNDATVNLNEESLMFSMGKETCNHGVMNCENSDFEYKGDFTNRGRFSIKNATLRGRKSHNNYGSERFANSSNVCGGRFKNTGTLETTNSYHYSQDRGILEGNISVDGSGNTFCFDQGCELQNLSINGKSKDSYAVFTSNHSHLKLNGVRTTGRGGVEFWKIREFENVDSFNHEVFFDFHPEFMKPMTSIANDERLRPVEMMHLNSHAHEVLGENVARDFGVDIAAETIVVPKKIEINPIGNVMLSSRCGDILIEGFVKGKETIIESQHDLRIRNGGYIDSSVFTEISAANDIFVNGQRIVCNKKGESSNVVDYRRNSGVAGGTGKVIKGRERSLVVRAGGEIKAKAAIFDTSKFQPELRNPVPLLIMSNGDIELSHERSDTYVWKKESENCGFLWMKKRTTESETDDIIKSYINVGKWKFAVGSRTGKVTFDGCDYTGTCVSTRSETKCPKKKMTDRAKVRPRRFIKKVMPLANLLREETCVTREVDCVNLMHQQLHGVTYAPTGDIKFGGSIMFGPGGHSFIAPNGSVIWQNSVLEHVINQKSRGLSLRVGPISFGGSGGIGFMNDPMYDTLGNCFSDQQHSTMGSIANFIDLGVETINTLHDALDADNLRGFLFDRYQLGDQHGVFSPSIDLSLEEFEMNSTFTVPGRSGFFLSSVEVNAEEFVNEGVDYDVNNLSVIADTWSERALGLNTASRMRNSNVTIGASTSGAVHFGASANVMSRDEHTYHLHRGFVRNHLYCDVNLWKKLNSQTNTTSVSGRADEVNFRGDFDETSETTYGGSFDTIGSMSAFYRKSTNKSCNTPSGVNITGKDGIDIDIKKMMLENSVGFWLEKDMKECVPKGCIVKKKMDRKNVCKKRGVSIGGNINSLIKKSDRIQTMDLGLDFEKRVESNSTDNVDVSANGEISLKKVIEKKTDMSFIAKIPVSSIAKSCSSLGEKFEKRFSKSGSTQSDSELKKALKSTLCEEKGVNDSVDYNDHEESVLLTCSTQSDELQEALESIMCEETVVLAQNSIADQQVVFQNDQPLYSSMDGVSILLDDSLYLNTVRSSYQSDIQTSMSGFRFDVLDAGTTSPSFFNSNFEASNTNQYVNPRGQSGGYHFVGGRDRHVSNAKQARREEHKDGKTRHRNEKGRFTKDPTKLKNMESRHVGAELESNLDAPSASILNLQMPAWLPPSDTVYTEYAFDSNDDYFVGLRPAFAWEINPLNIDAGISRFEAGSGMHIRGGVNTCSYTGENFDADVNLLDVEAHAVAQCSIPAKDFLSSIFQGKLPRGHVQLEAGAFVSALSVDVVSNEDNNPLEFSFGNHTISMKCGGSAHAGCVGAKWGMNYENTGEEVLLRVKGGIGSKIGAKFNVEFKWKKQKQKAIPKESDECNDGLNREEMQLFRKGSEVK